MEMVSWHGKVCQRTNHDGSVIVRIEKLKQIINQPFSRKFNGGLVAFVDRFQTSIEELGSLKSTYSSDEDKLDALITALWKVPSETSYYLDYIQDHELDFPRACAYLHERAMLKSTFDETDNKKFHKVSPPQFCSVRTNWRSIFRMIRCET